LSDMSLMSETILVIALPPSLMICIISVMRVRSVSVFSVKRMTFSMLFMTASLVFRTSSCVAERMPDMVRIFSPSSASFDIDWSIEYVEEVSSS